MRAIRRPSAAFDPTSRHPDVDATIVGAISWLEDGLPERLGLGSISSRVRPITSARAAIRSRDWDAIYVVLPAFRGLYRDLRDFPTVYSLDGTSAQLAAMPEYSPGLHAGVGNWIEERHFRRANRVEAFSDWAKQGTIELGVDPDRIAINPPGIDLDVWKPGDGPTPRADDDIRRIVFVGGDFERKGGADLLDWFRSQSDPSLELHLVTPADVEPGDGVFVHRLNAAQPEMHDLIRSSHISVLPSRAECYGLVSVEALASGVPVIQSAVGGSAHIVTDGVTGRIIPPRDPKALGAAVQEILADPERYAEMRRAARADALERFDIRRSVDRTIELIHEAIADAAAS